ncbi:hypothetical protein EK21DRAFT_107441 [Setomelanomma holmii]|uniref:Uncharacterized protein n=1 Tax=Setomelanomma holmii TaxID=210430 RepID=A0A9P4HJQ0_9PLEO|nr:hypothetical protein EK21DRAFT_107441 [Setomelanomma holmii]
MATTCKISFTNNTGETDTYALFNAAPLLDVTEKWPFSNFWSTKKLDDGAGFDLVVATTYYASTHASANRVLLFPAKPGRPYNITPVAKYVISNNGKSQGTVVEFTGISTDPATIDFTENARKFSAVVTQDDHGVFDVKCIIKKQEHEFFLGVAKLSRVEADILELKKEILELRGLLGDGSGSRFYVQLRLTSNPPAAIITAIEANVTDFMSRSGGGIWFDGEWGRSGNYLTVFGLAKGSESLAARWRAAYDALETRLKTVCGGTLAVLGKPHQKPRDKKEESIPIVSTKPSRSTNGVVNGVAPHWVRILEVISFRDCSLTP